MNSQTFKEPDFAYPQTVESDARALLASADRKSGTPADVTRLRGTLELCAAQTAIDRKAAFAQPAFIAGQAAKMKGAPRALMLALQASVLTEIYTSDKWKYDRVDAPAEPLPADVALWSGAQFRSQIDSLLRQAASIALDAPAMPLKTFEDCISQDKITLKYFPTVADFVLWQAYHLSIRCGSDEAEAYFRAEALKHNAAGTDPWFFWSAKGADEKDIWKTYCTYSSNEGARYLLVQLGTPFYGIEPASKSENEGMEENVFIDSLRSSLARFPRWYNNAMLKNNLAQLTAAKIRYTFQPAVAAGHETSVEVNYSYARKIEALLYSVPEKSSNLTVAQIMTRKPVAQATYVPQSDKGFATMRLDVPADGVYALLMRVDGRVVPDSRRNRIKANSLGSVIIQSTPAAAIAVDFASGKPVEGVTVNQIPDRSKKVTKTTPMGNTDKDGIFLWNNKAASINFTYKGKEIDLSGNNFAAPGSKPAEQPEVTVIKILTDRNLYHPGDTVSWAVVVARRAKGFDNKPAVVADETIEVKFYDANSQPVDTVKVTTDAFGRAFGSFVTKENQLTGNYSIRVDNGARATQYVMVSDFKMPTFEAKVTGIERSVPEPGMVRVHGTAQTFTGMPVSGASVDVAVTGAVRWRWFSPMEKLGTFNTTTTPDGTFSLDIPVDSLSAQSKNPYTSFLVDVTVTSNTAETATASRAFTIGKPYIIQLKKEDIKADTSQPVNIGIEALDADGNNVAMQVRWELGSLDENNSFGNIMAEGTASTSGTTQLQLGDVPAGRYTLRIIPDDSALADTTVTGDFVLYNIKRNLVPELNSPLFFPVTSFVSSGKSIEVPVGVATDKAYVYALVTKDENLVQLKPYALGKGFHRIKVPVAGVEDGNLVVRFFTMIDGKVTEMNIQVTPPPSAAPEIVAESFRDHLVPGAHETWRFRLAKGNNTLADAAMIATMYNRALESLQSASFPSASFTFWKNGGTPHICYKSYWREQGYWTEPFTASEVVIWPTPEFFYIGNMNVLYESAMLYNGVSDFASGSKMMKSNMMIRGTRSTAATTDMLVVEDSAEAEEEVPAEAGAADGGAEDKFDYRVAEQLQIFWKPVLVADADGNIDLVFDMPNAIGSWMFRAMAWTPALESASYMAECMSNKPVMVQPSLPRFLRQGDKAVLPATVYNNSGETAVVETVVELFDLATGKVASIHSSTDTIASGASAVVKIDIDVAADAQSVGYRARSRSGAFSDGEQTAIPVLASSANVVESTEFYLNPGDKSFSLNIPAKEADAAILTLQYCQNPVWTVVKAMRGLMDGGTTSTSNVGALFSALAGRYITSTNPAIADALKEWKANPSEEALVSMLAKNEDLKQLVLNQTPWVTTANSQTARMQTLAELLDPAATTAAIDKYVAALAKLQQADGGFAWGSWSKRSSVWCTETVLTTMGLANSLGMLPADNATLAGMLDKAYCYLQKEATRPDAPKTDMALALIAALYPDKSLNLGAREVVRATVADIAKNWRKDGTVSKAYDILILAANARQSLCRDIFESIRQFGVEQPGRGLFFPNVDDIRGYATIIQAYKTMKASDAEIDAMRQWILVRAQATDDLGAYNPDYVIAAVLLTGSNWTSVAVEPAVKVNGKELAVTAVERNTGYFTQTLTGQGRKGIKLEIGTNGVTPSYGSVVSIRRMPMSEIASRPGTDISIEKRVLVNRGGQWVETNDFALGERVRVQLTIQTKRDLEYLTINDERPAAFQPVDQLPGYVWAGGTAFYRENLDATTNLFIGYLSAGTYYITYDMTAATAGTFISGIATAQSQYAPEITAHSGAAAITVK